MELLIFWFAMAILVAIIAGNKGRSRFGWFIYGLLLWPVAMIHALVAKPDDESLVERGDMRKCPACAELVKREARRCRYCGETLEPLAAKPPPGGIDLTPNPPLPRRHWPD